MIEIILFSTLLSIIATMGLYALDTKPEKQPKHRKEYK